jgi:hypothetical protein
VRAQKGDDPAGAFYHDVSRAFFTEHAAISKREIIVPIAQHFGLSASDVEAAWRERRFSPTVDAFIEEAHLAGYWRAGHGVAESARDRRDDAGGRARASTSKRGALARISLPPRVNQQPAGLR